MQLLNPPPPPIKWNTSCIPRACFDCIPPLSSCSSQQSPFLQPSERAQAFCKADPKWWNLTSNMSRGAGWYASEKSLLEKTTKKCFSFTLFVKCRRCSLAERPDYTPGWASPKSCLEQSGNHTCLSLRLEFSSINLRPARGWVLAGSCTFSGTAQCLLANFTDELKQLEENNYCWSSVCASGVQDSSCGGDALGALRGAEVLPQGCGHRGMWAAPRLSPHPTFLGLHCFCDALARAASTVHALRFTLLFSLSFLLPRSYRSRPTQRNALPCICHSYMAASGHVTSISQFASLLYFILPLVSSCQRKAEGGAVRKAFFGLRFESTFLALTF